MGMLTWLRGLAGAATRAAVEGIEGASAPSPPLSPRLEQERRIWVKAQRYRQAFTERRKAQQAREAQAERTRLQHAQDEHEDRVALGLAMGRGHFPGDGEQEREPRVEFRPLEGDEGGQSGGEAGPRYGWFRFPR